MACRRYAALRVVISIRMLKLVKERGAMYQTSVMYTCILSAFPCTLASNCKIGT